MQDLLFFPIKNSVSSSADCLRRDFLKSAAAAVLAGMTHGNASAVENVLRPKRLLLPTGRHMQYLKLGEGDIPAIFIHGLLGKGKMYAIIHEQLKQAGITAIAPDVWGPGTDWWMRYCVQQAGNDIAV